MIPLNRYTRTAVSTALALCLLASTPSVAADQTHSWLDDSTATPTGRLIVKYRTPKVSPSNQAGTQHFKREIWRYQQQLKLERPISNRKELLKTDGHLTLEQLQIRARKLSAESDVEYASVEYKRYPLQQPNDPFYFGGSGRGDQSYLYDGVFSMNAPDAWDITTGSSSSVIAIVDTGILPDHPELSDRSIQGLGYDFVSGDGPQDYTSANDGNGRDDNPIDPGDACNGSTSSWHGTAVASVAAGNSNNGEGITSIDWNARILNARALGACGGTDADIIDAIRWSAGLPVAGLPDNPTPANVVNLSLGGPTECTKAYQDVIDELTQRNVTFVMAAGNEKTNALRSAPANCANVITVGSSTADGLIDNNFSNFGLKVTTATSGRDILAATNYGTGSANPNAYDYRKESGTSFSAALVSGAISLMHSLDPNLSPTQVRALLNESATSFASNSECDNYHCGSGILNLSKALTMLRDSSYNATRNIAMEEITNQLTSITLQEDINSSINGYKDMRYFAVSIPERGLFTALSDSTGNLFGYILNSSLSVVALDDNSGDGNNFRVAALIDPGTYYVAVERETHRASDGALPFTLKTSLSNESPAPFTFAPSNNNAANTLVFSETVVIDGLTDESVVMVSNGFYTLNNSEPQNTPLSISNGDRLQVAAVTTELPNSTTTATVTVGAYSTDFSATTASDESRLNGGLRLGNSGCSISPQSTGKATADPALLLMIMLACAALSRRRIKSFM